jgi:mitochondrial fission protein ELM1
LSDAPVTWLLLGDKRGDNRMVEVIAEHLPWPSITKRLVTRPEWVVPKPRVRSTLDHLDLAASDPLEPPWPDLVLTIGRRPSMAARWLAEQAEGRTKLVLVGKPSGSIEPYDLVIVSAEAFLPPSTRVMTIDLPLMRIDPTLVAAEAELWRPRLAALPRPWIAFLLGGPTGPFRYDDALVERVLDGARRTASGEGGTAFIVTSRRTPKPVVERLRQELLPAARLYAWGDEAAGNPYLALLGLADALLVTADSISMLTEAARLGRPLSVIPVSTPGLGRLDQWRRELVQRLFGGRAARYAPLLGRLGISAQTRDFAAFERLLVQRGLASSYTIRPPAPTGRAGDDVGRVVARLCQLMGHALPKPQSAANSVDATPVAADRVVGVQSR